MAPQKVVIIGGGIVGLAVAAAASRLGHAVTVLEKESRWAAHQTGRNSGVIHAGPYYAPGSLKARMCTAGNRSMKEFARRYGIPFAEPGKLIVATHRSQHERLERLHERALANGAPARLIDAAESRDFEPEVAATRALRVESTGIIDYAAVARKLVELAAANGAELVLGAEVTDIRRTSAKTVVAWEGETRTADLVINCAGLYSDRIARAAEIDPEVRIIPFRGEYYQLSDAARPLIRGLVYPVPDPNFPFLGVHLTKMIDGSVHAGPNAVLALAREGYTWSRISLRDTASAVGYPGFLRLARRNLRTGAAEVARSLSRKRFARSLAELVPAISENDIVRAEAGIRAQAVRRDGTLADDFIIHRAPGQVHVLNAPSPAATSALEIAAYICRAAALTSS